MRTSLQRNDLLHPELSYKVVGVLFRAQNKVGIGFRERTYQTAVKKLLKEEDIHFKEQVPVLVESDGKKLARYYLDFLIEDKVILEIKAQERFLRENIAQIYGYLKASGHELGIIGNFTRHGVRFKRLVNLHS